MNQLIDTLETGTLSILRLDRILSWMRVRLMSLKKHLLAVVLALLSFACGPKLLLASERDSDEIRDAWSAEYLKLATGTRIVSSTNPDLITLNPVPLMKWSNPILGNGTTSGDFFVWTRIKQPVAVGTFFSYVPSNATDLTMRRVAMAFHALVAEDLELEANSVKRTIQGTLLHQIEYQLEDFEVANTPARRLQQMRTLAKSCEAETILDGKPEPLRLLPQPLLVFGQAESERRQDKGNECALFAMVTGTDAEVLLLIQAVENIPDQKASWRITPARFTSLPFEIKVRSKTVWKSENVLGPSPFLSYHGLFFKPLDPR